MVAVDLSVWNAARLVRVPGTLNRKGDHTVDRSHRPAHIIEVAGDLTPTPHELLKQLAAMAPEEPERSNDKATMATAPLTWHDGYRSTALT